MPRAGIEVVGLVALLSFGCSVPDEGWPDEGDGGSADVDAPAALLGTVVDAGGAAVGGARVVTDPHGYETVSDADGTFVIEGLPADTYAVLAVADGWATGTTTGVTLAAGGAGSVEIVLQAPFPVNGVVEVLVLGPTGDPLEGAVVTCSASGSEPTDADGLARFTDLGGETVDIDVVDAEGTLWGRSLSEVEVPRVGGAQISLQLSGRPPSTASASASSLCEECHSDIYAAWSATAHGGATARAPGDALVARFEAGEALDLDGPSAWLDTAGGDAVVELTSTDDETRTYVVAGTIGDPRRATVVTTEIDGTTWPLPVAWVAADTERPDFPDGEERLVAGDTAPWFDTAGRFAFDDGDTPDPSTSAEAACFACHVTGTELTLLGDGGVELRSVGGGSSKWVEGAVGCVRCHGNASAHMAATTGDRSFVIVRPDHLDADRANDVCGQCHAGTVSADGDLPFPYSESAGLFEPGAALADYGTSDPILWASGAAAAPGQQADEHAASAHGQVGLHCFDCHDPHGEATGSDGKPYPALLRGDPSDNSLCTSCHLGLSFDDDEAVLAEHPGHLPYPPHDGYDPDGETEMGRCVRCHMPGTSARVAWGELTGSGDQPSHLFVALAPQQTVDVFEAARTDTLPLGSFPANACLDCHAWNVWRAESEGDRFGGPWGEPTDELTHQRLQVAYQEKFP